MRAILTAATALMVSMAVAEVTPVNEAEEAAWAR